MIAPERGLFHTLAIDAYIGGIFLRGKEAAGRDG
jgi:hypothetical protein